MIRAMSGAGKSSERNDDVRHHRCHLGHRLRARHRVGTIELMGSNSPSHDWYCQSHWLKRRKHHLMSKPLCEQCEREGRLTPANVVDHDGQIAVAVRVVPQQQEAIVEKLGYYVGF